MCRDLNELAGALGDAAEPLSKALTSGHPFHAKPEPTLYLKSLNGVINMATLLEPIAYALKVYTSSKSLEPSALSHQEVSRLLSAAKLGEPICTALERDLGILISHPDTVETLGEYLVAGFVSRASSIATSAAVYCQLAQTPTAYDLSIKILLKQCWRPKVLERLLHAVNGMLCASLEGKLVANGR